MKSFIAALRSLVLPYGRTSGKRIILDGDNGRIQVYDASGTLIAEISPDADVVKVFGAGGPTARLDPSAASGIADTPGPGLVLEMSGDVVPATLTEFDTGFTRGVYLRAPSPVALDSGLEGVDFAAARFAGRFHGQDPQIQLLAGDPADAPDGGIWLNGTFFGPAGEMQVYGGGWTAYTPAFTGHGSATFSQRVGYWRRYGDDIRFLAYAVVNAAGSGSSVVTITAPTAIDRSTRQVVPAHTESLTTGNNGMGTALAAMGGSGNVFDRIRNYSNGSLVGSDLLSTGIITVQGSYREGL